MKVRMALATSFIALCSLALPTHAAPPEGKGPGNSPGNSGNGGNGGHGGKGNPHASDNRDKGSAARHLDSNRRYDDQGRYYDDQGRYSGYVDGHRDRRGHSGGDNLLGELVYAGITAALAREYALEVGLGGYSSLPPGIRKNLARGKPLPPGIAKKLVPGSLLGRLPRHPGYEWRIAGTDLILISVATAVIADILYNVFD